jgi:hypothetical protein
VPHITSLAIWGIPAPAVLNAPFTLKVGVHCSARCRLAGQLVEVRDAHGGTVGRGRLCDAPLPDTETLYWADVKLQAPTVEGVSSWSVVFAASGMAAPHEHALASFTLRTAGPPEHRVAVSVFVRGAATPVEGVEVQLGPYRATTEVNGAANLHVPKGTYELSTRKYGYAIEPLTVAVDCDLTVRLESVVVPPKNASDPYPEGWWG